MSARTERLKWWLRLDWYRNDGWRWRVATLADKLRGQCWAELVSWALRHHEDDPDTPCNDLIRRAPFRSQTESCRMDASRNGSCYCAKVRTAEADAAMQASGADPAAVIVVEADL